MQRGLLETTVRPELADLEHEQRVISFYPLFQRSQIRPIAHTLVFYLTPSAVTIDMGAV